MNSLPIKGFQKTSLIDYQPYVVATIFLSNCNFRCPYCHNKELVANPEKLKDYNAEEIISKLKEKKNILDGVCISGGEPTLYPEIIPFILEIKSMGLRIKLDTNGSNPELIKKLLEKHALDYVAIDIKSDKEGYKKAIGIDFDIKKLEKTIEIIKNSKITFEFRTTVVPGLYSLKTAENIGMWLGGDNPYFLQHFVPKNTLDESYEAIKPFSRQDLKEFKGVLKQYFTTVDIR